MNMKFNPADLPEFDMVNHLNDEQDISQYLSIVLEEKDPEQLRHAMCTIARARGMNELASASGLTREALDNALRPDYFVTVMKLIGAMGLQISM